MTLSLHLRAVFLNFDEVENEAQSVGGPASKPHTSSIKATAASPATASTTEMSLKVRYDLPLKGQLTQNHQMLFYREDETLYRKQYNL
jgi:hypothetical protein